MASINALPNELLNRIVNYVHQKSDLASLRFVNHALGEIATIAYFATVPLYAHWWGYANEEDYIPFPNDIQYDSGIFENILNSDKIKKLVKKVDVYTCNPDCDHRPEWANGLHGSEVQVFELATGSNQLDDAWYSCFQRLPEFKNLRSVALIFDHHGGGINNGDLDDELILTTRFDRQEKLYDVMQLLGDRLKEVSLRNFQELCEDGCGEEVDTVKKQERERFLDGLESLRISFVHEQVIGEAGSTLKVGDCCDCFQVIPSHWLAPAQNLKNLTLYADVSFGWFPKFDLRGIYFPHLQSLCFGHLTLSHDWQTDWIVAHSSTLRGLYLDHCSILYQIGHAQGTWLDEEGYPKKDNGVHWQSAWGYSEMIDSKHGISEEEAATKLKFVSNPTRWHDIFTLFSSSLPRLRTFRFGSSSQWKFDVQNRHDDVGSGMPIMPWEAESEIENGLFEERYMIYDDWEDEYAERWQDHDHVINSDEKFWTAQMEEYPACWKEDELALRALLKKIGA